MLCHILDKGTCRDERGLCPETEWARLCSLGRDGRKDGEWRKGIGRGSGRVYKRKCGGGFWIERARPGMEDITEGALRSVEKTAREKIARKSRTAWDMEERGTGSRGRRETMMMVAVNPSRGRPDRKRFGRMFPTSLFPHHFLWMDVLSSFRYKYIRASPGIDSTDWRTFVPVGAIPAPFRLSPAHVRSAQADHVIDPPWRRVVASPTIPRTVTSPKHVPGGPPCKSDGSDRPPRSRSNVWGNGAYSSPGLRRSFPRGKISNQTAIWNDIRLAVAARAVADMTK